jgi:hypothetical protein
MDTSSTVEDSPATATEGAVAFDVVEDDFMSIYDVPFITVNRVDGKFFAEVVASDNESVTLSRVQEALEVGRRYGQHVYARKHGDIVYPELAGVDNGVILIAFTPDADGSL